jgi:hypothetical protein
LGIPNISQELLESFYFWNLENSKCRESRPIAVAGLSITACHENEALAVVEFVKYFTPLWCLVPATDERIPIISPYVTISRKDSSSNC